MQLPQLSPTIEQAKSKLAVALDFPSAHSALDCLDRLNGTCEWVKVGLELYCSAGNPFLEKLRARGLNVFLDLKLHDIPNTVAGAIRSVSNTGASLLTVHALGGAAMLSAAAEAAATMPGSARLLAVTLLTSMDHDQAQSVGLDREPAIQVLHLARLAISSGIDGLVCSAKETGLIRRYLGDTPFLVVPGIRTAGDALGDQRRIATPLDAIRSGASMLVVGRPITQAADPAAAAHAILTEIAQAHQTLVDA